MRRYSFRLDPVLRVRRNEEDAARGALLAAVSQVSEEQVDLEARRSRYESQVTQPCSGSARDFLSEQARRHALAQAVLEQQQRVHAAAARRDAARRMWGEAAARVGALERLDERQREEHRAAELREDDRVTDELVVSRHGRGDR